VIQRHLSQDLELRRQIIGLFRSRRSPIHLAMEYCPRRRLSAGVRDTPISTKVVVLMDARPRNTMSWTGDAMKFATCRWSALFKNISGLVRERGNLGTQAPHWRPIEPRRNARDRLSIFFSL
jgi:hypothetical protein